MLKRDDRFDEPLPEEVIQGLRLSDSADEQREEQVHVPPMEADSTKPLYGDDSSTANLDLTPQMFPQGTVVSATPSPSRATPHVEAVHDSKLMS